MAADSSYSDLVLVPWKSLSTVDAARTNLLRILQKTYEKHPSAAQMNDDIFTKAVRMLSFSEVLLAIRCFQLCGKVACVSTNVFDKDQADKIENYTVIPMVEALYSIVAEADLPEGSKPMSNPEWASDEFHVASFVESNVFLVRQAARTWMVRCCMNSDYLVDDETEVIRLAHARFTFPEVADAFSFVARNMDTDQERRRPAAYNTFVEAYTTAMKRFKQDLVIENIGIALWAKAMGDAVDLMIKFTSSSAGATARVAWNVGILRNKTSGHLSQVTDENGRKLPVESKITVVKAEEADDGRPKPVSKFAMSTTTVIFDLNVRHPWAQGMPESDNNDSWRACDLRQLHPEEANSVRLLKRLSSCRFYCEMDFGLSVDDFPTKADAFAGCISWFPEFTDTLLDQVVTEMKPNANRLKGTLYLFTINKHTGMCDVMYEWKLNLPSNFAAICHAVKHGFLHDRGMERVAVMSAMKKHPVFSQEGIAEYIKCKAGVVLSQVVRQCYMSLCTERGTEVPKHVRELLWPCAYCMRAERELPGNGHLSAWFESQSKHFIKDFMGEVYRKYGYKPATDDPEIGRQLRRQAMNVFVINNFRDGCLFDTAAPIPTSPVSEMCKLSGSHGHVKCECAHGSNVQFTESEKRQFSQVNNRIYEDIAKDPARRAMLVSIMRDGKDTSSMSVQSIVDEAGNSVTVTGSNEHINANMAYVELMSNKTKKKNKNNKKNKKQRRNAVAASAAPAAAKKNEEDEEEEDEEEEEEEEVKVVAVLSDSPRHVEAHWRNDENNLDGFVEARRRPVEGKQRAILPPLPAAAAVVRPPSPSPPLPVAAAVAPVVAVRRAEEGAPSFAAIARAAVILPSPSPPKAAFVAVINRAAAVLPPIRQADDDEKHREPIEGEPDHHHHHHREVEEGEEGEPGALLPAQPQPQQQRFFFLDEQQPGAIEGMPDEEL